MRVLFPLVLVGFLALQGCGTDTSRTLNSGCANNTAILAVYDGAIQNLCGCQESSTDLIAGNQGVTCTVSQGSTVIFQYIRTQLPHQIAGSGTPQMGTSPLSQPKDEIPLRTFSLILNQAGTYSFEDLYDLTINGQIIVQ